MVELAAHLAVQALLEHQVLMAVAVAAHTQIPLLALQVALAAQMQMDMAAAAADLAVTILGEALEGLGV
jgi:hypothetical protein